MAGPYRYLFAPAQSCPDDFLDSLAKIDASSGESQIWQESDCYPGESVFISKPGAATEDDGILLSVVLNAREATSFLLVLDALSMTEIARAAIPYMVPFGFHGQYFNN